MHTTPLPLPYRDRSLDVWLLDNTALAHSPKAASRVGTDTNVWPERFYPSEVSRLEPRSIRLEKSEQANRGSLAGVSKPTDSVLPRGGFSVSGGAGCDPLSFLPGLKACPERACESNGPQGLLRGLP